MLAALIQRRPVVPQRTVRAWSQLRAANAPMGVRSRWGVVQMNRARAILAHTLLRAVGL